MERRSRVLSSLFNPIDILNEIIEEVCKNPKEFAVNPDKDFTRGRKLPMKRLVKLILEMQGGTLKSEIRNSFPILEKRMSASAFVQQRKKLKAQIFHKILLILKQYLDNEKTFKGLKVFAIDGTDCYFPVNPKSECFIKRTQKRKDGSDKKDYCLLHANILYDLINKLYVDCITGPKNGSGGNERNAAIRLINQYATDKSLFIMDRGYIGYNMIEHGNRCGGYYMIRSLTGNGSIPEIRDLPNKPTDKWLTIKIATKNRKIYMDNGYRLYQIIQKHYKDVSELHKDTIAAANKQWDFEEACEVRFRIVKFRINDTGKDQWEVIVTNLPSNKFPMEDIKKLYAMRWGIETAFRSLKYAVGAIQFHSKQDEFVKQELFAHLVMYNITSACAACADVSKTNAKHEYKVNFKEAVGVVRKFFRERIDSFELLRKEIAQDPEPVRPGRKDKRKLRQRAPVYFIYRVPA